MTTSLTLVKQNDSLSNPLLFLDFMDLDTLIEHAEHREPRRISNFRAYRVEPRIIIDQTFERQLVEHEKERQWGVFEEAPPFIRKTPPVMPIFVASAIVVLLLVSWLTGILPSMPRDPSASMAPVATSGDSMSTVTHSPTTASMETKGLPSS